MSTVDDLLKNAFYLANILSAEGGQSPSASQSSYGLQILNQILDSMSLDSTFAPFIDIYSIPCSTRFLRIGATVTAPDSNYTAFNSTFFSSILSANAVSSANGTLHYGLAIRRWTELDRTTYVDYKAIPTDLYCAIRVDSSNNPFNEIEIYPNPSSTYTFNIKGLVASQSYSSGTDAIVSTFFQFLTYKVAFELSMYYGTESQWSMAKQQRMDNLHELIISSSNIDLTTTDNSNAFSRYGNFFIAKNN